jgi:dipeptidyl aminopeptidase/acylaminoacyl peptidase
MAKHWLPAFVLLGIVPAAFAADSRPVLDDFFSDLNMVDAAVSPSGKFIASIVRRADDDILVSLDLEARKSELVQSSRHAALGKHLELHMESVEWKTDERLLVRMNLWPVEGRRVQSLASGTIGRLGKRLVSIKRDGSGFVSLLAENHDIALEGAFDRADIASLLPLDPKNILLQISGFNGRSLYKVDVETGQGTQIEPPWPGSRGWWLDVHGNPAVRINYHRGSISFSRKESDKWVRFLSMRLGEMRERPEYDLVGPSDQPGRHYVLARADRERVGLYLYDVTTGSFGEPLIENPEYDLSFARISRDGTRVLYTCYVAHVRICEFTDPKIDAHIRGLRRYFEETANVFVRNTSEDGETMLLFVEGPHDPPGYYYYRTTEKHIEPLGSVRPKLAEAALPRATVVRYQARDGKTLTGYLTKPAGAAEDAKLPLIVHPHGGPERRDSLTFDPWVQFFAARGYAVFQVNFRGSDGFGKAFVESGYGEWGRKMQDDITDGVKALVEQGTVDPARMCIVGASYGGYAALAGAALTPELFKCAVSVAGISDLDDFISYRLRNWGRDSKGYTYWLKAIGDPGKDAQKLRATSPVHIADRIRIPVLLVHGSTDGVVPLSQSQAMKRALERAGRKVELVEIHEEGHSWWSDDNEKLALSSIDAFLSKHLGSADDQKN